MMGSSSSSSEDLEGGGGGDWQLTVITGWGRHTAKGEAPVLVDQMQRWVDQSFQPPLATSTARHNRGRFSVSGASIDRWIECGARFASSPPPAEERAVSPSASSAPPSSLSGVAGPSQDTDALDYPRGNTFADELLGGGGGGGGGAPWHGDDDGEGRRVWSYEHLWDAEIGPSANNDGDCLLDDGGDESSMRIILK